MPKRYWWIVTKDESGKHYLIFGSDRSEDAARQKGFEILGGMNFVIRQYPTKDLGTASSLWRGAKLNTSHNIKEARQRLGHNKSLERLHARKLERERSGGW